MAQKMLKSLETMLTIFRMQSRQSMNRSMRLSRDVTMVVAEETVVAIEAEGTTTEANEALAGNEKVDSDQEVD